MSRRWLLLILLVWGGVFPHTASSQPPRVVRSVERAVMAMNAKQYAEAEKILRRVVQRYPDYFEARYELALALSLQGRYDEALAECIVICDTAVPRDKQRDHYFQLLGNLYAQKDDSTNADHAYQLGLRRFPTSARLHVEVAIRHAMRGDLEEALESIENAISGDPTYPLSYYWGHASTVPRRSEFGHFSMLRFFSTSDRIAQKQTRSARSGITCFGKQSSNSTRKGA